MKHRLLTLALIFISTTVPVTFAENTIIHNGDSLDGIRNDFGKKWGCMVQVNASVDTHDKHSGEASIKLEINVPSKWASFCYNVDNISIPGDQNTKLNIWFKGDPKAYIRPVCSITDAQNNGFELTKDAFKNLGRNTEWKCFTVDISQAKPKKAGTTVQFPLKRFGMEFYNKFPGTFTIHVDEITAEN